MQREPIPPSAIPDWFPEVVGVMQETDRHLRTIEIELRHAMTLHELDARLLADFRSLRDVLERMQAGLLQTDEDARQVLLDIAHRDRSEVEQEVTG